jgi:peptidoglycan/xylan/chitin deacetylase (PgdA/CDA1 family)
MDFCRADKLLLTGSAALLGSSVVFGAAPLAIAIPAAALVAVLADGIFRPSSSALYPTISHGPRNRARVALTFDDGPDPEVTPAILDALAAIGARATFFVIGRNLDRHHRIAERIVAEGHELGNHSWTHSHLQNFYTARRYATDIDRAEDLIRQISGAGPTLYRPPVGLKSPALARTAHARSLTIVAWSVHSRDTLSHSAPATAERVLSRVRAGDIVLMHDGHDREGAHRTIAARALPAVLRGLKDRELQPVTVSELLGRSGNGASGAMQRG